MQIEKNIPLPTKRERETKYPFGNMSVGDSFSFPIEDRRRISNASHSYSIRKDVEFAIRKIDEQTCRIWRTK